MIRIYTGFLGSGKSASMVQDGQDIFCERFPDVVTNIASLHFPHASYMSSKQHEKIQQLEDCLLMLDEAHVSFDAQFWQRIDEDTLRSFTMMRKASVDILMTSQVIGQVASRLRTLINEEVYCRKVGPVIVQTYRVPEKKEVLRRRFMRIRPATFRLYDTMEFVGDRKTGSMGRSEAHRQLREAKTRKRRSRLEFTGRYYERPITRVYDRRASLTPEARAVYNELRELGVITDGFRHWHAVVSHEVARRAWLADFGISGQFVNLYPATCSYATPWLPGHSPEDIGRELAEQAQVEAVIEGLSKKQRAAIVEQIRSLGKEAGIVSGSMVA